MGWSAVCDCGISWSHLLFPSAYMPNVYDDCHNFCVIQKYTGYNSFIMLRLQLLLKSDTIVPGSRQIHGIIIYNYTPGGRRCRANFF